MKAFVLGIGLSLIAVFSCPALGAEEPGELQAHDTSEPGFVVSVDSKGGDIAAMRLEIFDAVSGESLHDSGVQEGANLHLSSELRGFGGASKYELRAWDWRGDLTLSQTGRLAGEGLEEIFSIDFEVVPAGTSFNGGGSPINLDGDVEVSGSLSTATIQKSGGAAFFATCAAGTSIRQILADGSVICEVDDAGGGGDDLGNHQATQTLVMGSNWAQFNSGFGLRSLVGAEVKSGPEGRSVVLQPANNFPASSTDIARFNDQNGVFILGVPQEGSFKFARGHKVCRVLDNGTNRTDSIIASAGWTADTCSGYANSVGLDSYQLVCVNETGFSFGAVNSSTPPNVNCGW